MAEEPTAEDLEKLAKKAEEETIDLDSVDMSLPVSTSLIQQRARDLYSTLSGYQLAIISAKANRASANNAEAERQDKQALYLKNLAALIQKEFPTARKVMLEMVAAEKAVGEA